MFKRSLWQKDIPGNYELRWGGFVLYTLYMLDTLQYPGDWLAGYYHDTPSRSAQFDRKLDPVLKTGSGIQLPRNPFSTGRSA